MKNSLLVSLFLVFLISILQSLKYFSLTSSLSLYENNGKQAFGDCLFILKYEGFERVVACSFLANSSTWIRWRLSDKSTKANVLKEAKYAVSCSG